MKLWPRLNTPNLRKRSSQSDAAYFAELMEIFGMEAGDDGLIMSRQRLLEIPAAWCAINVISSKIAQMPVHFYRTIGSERLRTYGEPDLERLLNRSPAPGWTAYTARRDWLQDALIEGRGYQWIERDADGEIENIWPLPCYSVNTNTQGGYTVTPIRDYARPLAPINGHVPRSDMLVLSFFGRGAYGVYEFESPRYRLSRALGLSWWGQDFARRFFSGGGMTQLIAILKAGHNRDTDTYLKVVKDLIEMMRRVQVMDGNIFPLPNAVEKVEKTGAEPDKTQMIETRKFQIAEASRIWNIPPVMLHDLEHGTYANTAQQDTALAKHTLSDWVTQIEQEYSVKCFSRQSDLCADLDMTQIQRADFVTRQQANRNAVMSGGMKPNEVRVREGREPDANPRADETWMPSNLLPLGSDAWDQMGGKAGASESSTDIADLQAQIDQLKQLLESAT